MFTMLEKLFKPIVMFFRLTNSPATFQTIMNEILRNLINTREVVSFINNVIIEVKKKKEHNKIGEKVVKRLEKNDLYIEKCRVSRSINQARQDQDGRREGKSSSEMTSL